MPRRKPSRNQSSSLVLVLIVVAVLLLGLTVGVAYVIGSIRGSNTTTSSGSHGDGSQCSGEQCQSPTRGTVIAFSATSITVQPSGGGSPKTFTVTDTTQVINANGGPSNYGTYGPGNLGAYNVNDLQNGDTVAIVPSSSNPNQALRIILNPPNGGNGTNSGGS